MISLKNVSDWVKNLDTKFKYYYIGTLDSKKDNSLGVYNLKRSIKPIVAIGGLNNALYNIKRISLLVHGNKSSIETEDRAFQLYEELMNNKPNKIGNHHIYFIGMMTNEPVDVGRDDNGICEYVIELEIYYKREEEV